MASTILRGVNSTNVPLLANGIFLGGSEFAGSLLTVLVNCYADTEIKVEVFEIGFAFFNSDLTSNTNLSASIIFIFSSSRFLPSLITSGNPTNWPVR